MTDAEFEDYWQKSRMLYPGDWIWFKDAADFYAFWGDRQPLPENCIGLGDSEQQGELNACLDTLACGCKLADQPGGFYYHRKGHIGRCCDCQSAEWIAQGFEVVKSFPWGDWNATPAERIVQRDRAALQDAERWLSRKLETKRGKVWLQTEQGQAWQAEQKWQSGNWRANFEEQWRKRQQKRNMTPGEFIAEATRLFNATPATHKRQQNAGRQSNPAFRLTNERATTNESTKTRHHN